MLRTAYSDLRFPAISRREDIEAAVALLRRSYELACEQQTRKYGTAAFSPV